MDLAITLVLAVGIGLSLGLLGGGGSILTVPILLYASQLSPKGAIATSLLVVAAVSAVALVPHARAGNVRWRTGLLFGAAAMAGAYAGGWLARYLPGEVLLVMFAAVMLVTAIAMMRGRGEPEAAPAAAAGPSDQAGPPDRAGPPPATGRADRAARAPRSPLLIAVEGVAVGAITGMVGAGGGFLVVPALALLGGLPIRAAIGTSLLVIVLKSLAGFAGYVSHVPIDWALAASVAGAAAVGAIGGAALCGRVRPDALRTGFAWFVIAMAIFLVSRQLPSSVTASAAYRAVFVDRWPWYVGAAAIGLFVLALLYLDNVLLGVSTGCAELVRARRDPAVRRSWRPPFLAGIVLGGLASGLLSGRGATLALGSFDAVFSASPWIKVPVLVGAGVLIGYGARTAGGCTSGHSIVGVAQGARSSVVATAMFLAAGFAVTHLVALAAGV